MPFFTKQAEPGTLRTSTHMLVMVIGPREPTTRAKQPWRRVSEEGRSLTFIAPLVAMALRESDVMKVQRQHMAVRRSVSPIPAIPTILKIRRGSKAMTRCILGQAVPYLTLIRGEKTKATLPGTSVLLSRPFVL